MKVRLQYVTNYSNEGLLIKSSAACDWLESSHQDWTEARPTQTQARLMEKAETDGSSKSQPSMALTPNQGGDQQKKLDSSTGNAERLPKEGEPHQQPDK